MSKAFTDSNTHTQTQCNYRIVNYGRLSFYSCDMRQTFNTVLLCGTVGTAKDGFLSKKSGEKKSRFSYRRSSYKKL